MRTKVMAANWKMYKIPDQTREFFRIFLPLVSAHTRDEIVVCPPFLDLPAALAAIQGSNVAIGGQNVHWKEEGAFTGETSAAQLLALGVTHVYLSPILQANPGSPHGYDVVDHSRVSTDLGGEPAFREMADEFHRHGLGVVVDVVPNHMARPTPESLNAQLWSVLHQGRKSPYAHWFDVDWDAQDGRLLDGGDTMLKPNPATKRRRRA